MNDFNDQIIKLDKALEICIKMSNLTTEETHLFRERFRDLVMEKFFTKIQEKLSPDTLVQVQEFRTHNQDKDIFAQFEDLAKILEQDSALTSQDYLDFFLHAMDETTMEVVQRVASALDQQKKQQFLQLLKTILA